MKLKIFRPRVVGSKKITKKRTGTYIYGFINSSCFWPSLWIIFYFVYMQHEASKEQPALFGQRSGNKLKFQTHKIINTWCTNVKQCFLLKFRHLYIGIFFFFKKINCEITFWSLLQKYLSNRFQPPVLKDIIPTVKCQLTDGRVVQRKVQMCNSDTTWLHESQPQSRWRNVEQLAVVPGLASPQCRLAEGSA